LAGPDGRGEGQVVTVARREQVAGQAIHGGRP
jgi:hypothetical protein